MIRVYGRKEETEWFLLFFIMFYEKDIDNKGQKDYYMKQEKSI